MSTPREARPADFYDDLAPTYHRLYPDWEAAVRSQAAALDGLLAASLGEQPLRILDAATGIGTQLVGLAARGHALWGTDISRGAVRRARHECSLRHLAAGLAVADMRALPFPDRHFDAVVCADNAVPHLMSATEVTAALRELGRVTRRDGVVLVSIRDYEEARRLRPPGTLPQVATTPEGATSVTFQVWAWDVAGRCYDLQHFQVAGADREWSVVRRTAKYWAITRAELTGCAAQAGLVEGTWVLPQESGFFQPVLLARVR